MPSARAIGLRREAAIKVIEDAIPGLALPRQFNWKQRGMEDVVILETIADYIAQDDAIEGDGSGEALPDYEAMNRDELEAEAEALGILDSIEGTGANGNVLVDDLREALFNAGKSDGDA